MATDGTAADPGRAAGSGDSRVETELVLRATIARQLRLPPDNVIGDVDLRTDLGVDDAQLPVLLTAMGEALDVRFPDDFFDGVHTFAQLSAAVRVSLSPQ